MQTVELPLGPWLPDAPSYRNPGCIVADGCYPSTEGYAPFLGATATGDETAGTCKGAAQFFRADGSSVICFGIDDALGVIAGGTVTMTAGYTSIGTNGYWRFGRFNDQIIAVAPNNSPQYLTDIDTDTSWSGLPGTPPQAEAVGRVGDFLVLGNLSGNKSRIQWSAQNDTSWWTQDYTKQASFAELQPEYGQITGFGGDRYPMVFQERGVFRMVPVGPPTVFDVNEPISESRGCIAPGSIVTVGFRTYFLSHDGFCVTDGADMQVISNRKLTEWFFDQVSETDRFRTHGAVNWARQSIVWAYVPSTGSGFERQIIYNWSEDRWSTAAIEVDYLVSHKVGETTLDALDAIYGDLDSIPGSLDDAMFKAKNLVFAGFIQDGSGNTELNTFDGSALAATFETGEFEPRPGYRVSINKVFPLVENADANTTAAMITRATKGGAETTSSATTENAAAFCPQRVDGRWARIKLAIPAAANWDHAQGCQVEYRISGGR